MVSHHIFYQLVLLGLLWLCMMLHVMWPSDRPVLAPRPPQPVAPPRKRSKAPKPFAGLLHRPQRPCHLPPPCRSSPAGDARARWTPRSISARTPPVTIGAG